MHIDVYLDMYLYTLIVMACENFLISSADDDKISILTTKTTPKIAQFRYLPTIYD